MIRGAVNAREEAVVRLRLRGPSGTESDLDAIIDSGFTSSLTLPAPVVAALGLARQAPGATGSVRGTHAPQRTVRRTGPADGTRGTRRAKRRFRGGWGCRRQPRRPKSGVACGNPSHPAAGAIWEMDDAELIAAARKHLAYWNERPRPPGRGHGRKSPIGT